MSSRAPGFTLIEAVVAILIAALTVIGLGNLGERIIHHRTTSNSNSAAMALAERQMEILLASPVPNPIPCASANSSPLCNGTHTALNLNADGTTTNPTHRVVWTVTDATQNSSTSPFVVPTVHAGPSSDPKMKQITVVVTHLNNPQVNATLVRHFRAY